MLCKVLVVDDRKHIRLLYGEELERMARVATARTESVSGPYRAEEPDVIVLDIKWSLQTVLTFLQRS